MKTNDKRKKKRTKLRREKKETCCDETIEEKNTHTHRERNKYTYVAEIW